MNTLKIGQEGIVLHGAPGSAQSESASKPSVKPLQAMRLELEDDVLDHIIRSAQSGGKGVHMSFGKNIVRIFLLVPTSDLLRLTLLTDPRLRKQIQTIDRHSSADTNRNIQLRQW